MTANHAIADVRLTCEILLMGEPKSNVRWTGRIIGLALFVLVGLPWSLLFLLGERECDMHIGPPCAVSWLAGKLINFAIVVLLCSFAGWGSNRLINQSRRPSDPNGKDR